MKLTKNDIDAIEYALSAGRISAPEALKKHLAQVLTGYRDQQREIEELQDTISELEDEIEELLRADSEEDEEVETPTRDSIAVRLKVQ